MANTSAATQASEPLLAAPTAVISDNAYEDREGSKGHYEFECPPRPWWHGKLNVYLAAVYIYVIWFVCTRAPWRFTNGDPMSPVAAVHIINACLYALVCCANVFHTPKHGSVYRTVHMALGRFGNFCGVVSVITGTITLFTYEYPASQRIQFTIGGIGQLLAQFMGMRALFKKERDLKEHEFYMKLALYIACLVPALQRLPQLTGVNLGEYWDEYAWFWPLPIYFLSENAFRRGPVVAFCGAVGTGSMFSVVHEVVQLRHCVPVMEDNLYQVTWSPRHGANADCSIYFSGQ